jgi:hypothetical protein
MILSAPFWAADEALKAMHASYEGFEAASQAPWKAVLMPSFTLDAG